MLRRHFVRNGLITSCLLRTPLPAIALSSEKVSSEPIGDIDNRTLFSPVSKESSNRPSSSHKTFDSPPASVDLLIVGSGAAGLSCACRAKELGIKSVLVVEKEPLIGGSSIICGGHWSVAVTKFQKQLGVADSPQSFYNDLMNNGNGKCNPALVQKFIDSGRRQYEFITSNGINPFSLWAAGGSVMPRTHVFDAATIVRFLLQRALDGGVNVLTSSPVIAISIDPQDHSPVVLLRRAREQYPIKAKAVLLASGGFGNNRQMLERYVSDLDNVQIFSGNGNTGDGHKIGLALGGQLIDTEFIKPSYGFIRNASEANDFTMIFYSGAVILDQNGKRFVNESISYKDIGLASLAQPNGRTFIVFDEAIRKSQLENRPPEERLWRHISQDSTHVFYDDDLETTARKAGLHPKNTVDTILSYNKYVEAGFDKDFGRNTLSGGFGKPVKIESKPFYIMPALSGIMGTYCGLKVNDKTQLVKKDGSVIPNVLAAGEIMGGVHGENFTPGCGFGKALAFGRAAAETAATQL